MINILKKNLLRFTIIISNKFEFNNMKKIKNNLIKLSKKLILFQL